LQWIYNSLDLDSLIIALFQFIVKRTNASPEINADNKYSNEHDSDFKETDYAKVENTKCVTDQPGFHPLYLFLLDASKQARTANHVDDAKY
jgi:hypothetical protein